MDLTPTDLAYAAGVLDSDGYIGVQRSDYRMRVRKDGQTPTYSARVMVKQVTPEAIDLLHAGWAGYRGSGAPTAKRGRPLYTWEAKAAAAARCLKDVLPYLRIKRAQALNALEVCRIVQLGPRRFTVPAVVPGEPMVTVAEAAERLGKSYETVYQAVREGSVPCIRGARNGSKPSVFIPESYLPVWASRGHTPSRAPETVAQLHACFLRAKELNRVGV